MSAAVPWFLLNTPHQPCLHGWCRGSRFTPLVLPLKPLYPGPLKTALPERNRRRARTQLPLDLAIAQPLRQGKHDSRPEYISSRQSTRLRPALQFLALLLTHLQQLPTTSHAIETQWPCFTYHRDGPLVACRGEFVSMAGYDVERQSTSNEKVARFSSRSGCSE